MNAQIDARLKTLPNRPGCYLMRDRQGAIIYVGKAKNLKRRVSSYFRKGAKHAPKVRSMVDTVYDFEFMTVKNEAESLLTEAALIKKYKPHFNILMRDDKRYLALRADSDAPWPRFECVRIVREDGAKTRLYNVVADPFEENDLAARPEHAELLRRLESILDGRFRR